MTQRKSTAAERRWHRTIAALEAEAVPVRAVEAQRQGRIGDLRGAVVRYKAARGMREEVELAATQADPDAAQVARLRAERLALK